MIAHVSDANGYCFAVHDNEDWALSVNSFGKKHGLSRPYTVTFFKTLLENLPYQQSYIVRKRITFLERV